MKNVISIYNKKRSLFVASDSLQMSTVDCNFLAIVVPAYNEYPGIFDTLNSLSDSVCTALAQFNATVSDMGTMITVVVVINNPADVSEIALKNNQSLYTSLNQRKSDYHFKLLICNLSDDSVLKTIPLKKLGVGYARRYGMDWAVANGVQVIACMDADTLVSKNYIAELLHFGESEALVSLCQFEHQKVKSEVDDAKTLQSAIDCYEEYIKCHSVRLKDTGTPYWAYALGPTIVCKTEAYVAVGGMPIRSAGEDFYFIQSLEKLILQKEKTELEILDCTIYPSARLSDRVPFGTGSVLADAVAVRTVPFLYFDTTYEAIKTLIAVLHENISEIKDGDLESIWNLLPENVVIFLKNENFENVWKKLCWENKRKPQKLEIAFHVWFDGLKIIRFMHFLENSTSHKTKI